MKRPLHPFASSPGSILVFSLVIVLAGATILTGWIYLLAARTTFSEQATVGLERRVALLNARAAARQFLFNSMNATSSGNFTATTMGAGFSDWGGGFSMNGTLSMATTQTGNQTIPNRFGPGERFGFVEALDATIYSITTGNSGSTEKEAVAWSFRMRSCNPALAGYPLTLQAGGNSSSVTVQSPGASLTWIASQFESSFAAVPFIPMSSGTGSSYNGSLAVSPSGSESELTLNGTVASLDLGNCSTAYKLTSATANLTLAITGGSAAAGNPVKLVADTNTLANVTLSGNNTRGLVLWVLNTNATISSNASSTWRMLILSQNGNLTWNGPTTIEGGVRTNGNLNGNGALTLSVDPNSPDANLESLADKIFWLEDWRQ